MDPGTAVGVASLGIQCCQGVIGYYRSYREQDEVVAVTTACVDDLHGILVALHGMINPPGPQLNTNVLALVIKSIASCEGLANDLKAELDKFGPNEPQATPKKKAHKHVMRALYPFKKSTLIKLREIVQDFRGNLSLAIETVGLDTQSRILDTLDGLTLNFEAIRTDRNSLGGDIQNISTAISGVGDSISNVSRTVDDSRTIITGLSTSAQNIQQSINTAEQRTEDAQTDQIYSSVVDWLRPIDFMPDHRAARKRHEPETGNWFLEGRPYEAWKTAPKSFLWVNGNPGCGKTILASAIIEDLVGYVKSQPNSVLLSFYFSFTDSQKQEYASFLRTLLGQLCHSRRQIPLCLQGLFKAYRPLAAPVDELDECLKLVMKDFANVYLVIDALDECRNETGRGDWEDMLHWLDDLSSLNMTHLHTLVTSRNEPEIQNLFLPEGSSVRWPSLTITKRSNSGDVQTYVTNQIEKDWKLKRLDSTIKEEIRRTLTNGAEGMFRWAFCQMEAIKRLRVFSPDSVQYALSTLPATLDETYNRILNGLESQREAFTALQWLAFSARPIEPFELAEACIVDPEAETQVNERKRFHWEQLSDLLPSLVTVTGMRRRSDSKWTAEWDSTKPDSSALSRGKRNPGTIRLAHFSVKEFLVSEGITRGKAAAFSIQAGLANSFIVRSCIAYITYYAESPRRLSWDRDFSTFPLIKYACENWHDHYRRSADQNSTQMVDMLMHRLTSDLWLTSAHGISVLDQPLGYLPFDARKPQASLLYYAAYLGFEALVARLLCYASSLEVNAQGGVYGTALQAASRGGTENIVERLLHAGADVNLVAGKHGTALQAAAKHGYEHIVRLLISHGANVSLKGGQFGCALSAAILFDRDSVFTLLLARCADIVPSPGGSDEWDEWQPMCIAACTGSYGFLKLMLEKSESASEVAWYNSLLWHALRNGHENSVKLLQEAGAKIDGLDRHGESALYKASLYGDQSVVKRVLDHGADINALGGSRGTALHIASSAGELDIVKLLLANGADVNKEGYYGTALQAAATKETYPGIDSETEFGLEENVEFSDPVPSGVRREIVELLLQHGSNIGTKGGHHGTALQAALHSGYEELVNLLVERGANSNCK
ncbi:MAG: hypothetical protein Q9157_007759 [Trypethelium eluteriae]